MKGLNCFDDDNDREGGGGADVDGALGDISVTYKRNGLV